jgi:ribonuclease HII
MENKFIAGLDEVGRGCLAGPVLAAAVILDMANIPPDIKDSKKIAKKKRREIFHNIILSSVCYGTGLATVTEIEKFNILNATKIAMQRAIEALNIKPSIVLVDGNFAPEIPYKTQCIINGDNLDVSISAASIIAKVTRDLLMQRLHMDFPEYNWSQNAGYGTKEHILAIERYGISEHHRKTFMPIKRMISSGVA